MPDLSPYQQANRRDTYTCIIQYLLVRNIQMHLCFEFAAKVTKK